MAAADAYRAATATFSTAILGIESIDADESGNTTDLSTDAAKTVTAVFVDQIVHQISIVTTDIARLSSLTIGDTGSLVVTYQKRAEGSGAAASSPTKTATYANATLVSKPSSMPTVGKGTATAVFRCSAPGGTSPVAWS